MNAPNASNALNAPNEAASPRARAAGAFFFDRDGIVNKRHMGGYVVSPEDFEFIPDFFSLFRYVKEQNFLAIIVTNQQGIGKGLMSEDDLRAIHDAMQRELRRVTGFAFDDIFFAGELDASRFKGCCGEVVCPPARRKPSPAMLLEARDRWNIDLSKSWMIGDSPSDAEAARAAGAASILVGDYERGAGLAADYVVPNLKAALALLGEVFNPRYSCRA